MGRECLCTGRCWPTLPTVWCPPSGGSRSGIQWPTTRPSGPRYTRPTRRGSSLTSTRRWSRWVIHSAVEQVGHLHDGGAGGSSARRWNRWVIHTAVEQVGHPDGGVAGGSSTRRWGRWVIHSAVLQVSHPHGGGGRWIIHTAVGQVSHPHGGGAGSLGVLINRLVSLELLLS